ncbi:hypothetical protein PIB30_051733 [Stylosanthes scabra]|uniref:Uncharacterized protein n=1 Tax=Stylosanthes scabra TaxID=79078 RepID=A0ABU6SHW5_9FABA|nr:hypothetical protein [Stylosanthes scabra]
MLAKYVQNGNILDLHSPSRVSGTWQGILKALVKLKDEELPFLHIPDTNLLLSDLWWNGTWHLDGLFTALPDSLRQLVLSINLDVQGNHVKGWVWKSNSSHVYSTKDAWVGPSDVCSRCAASAETVAYCFFLG